MKLQDEATQALLAERHRLGALTFDQVEAEPVISDGRVLRPPTDGRLIHGERGLDVGDRLRVKLVSTDPERG